MNEEAWWQGVLDQDGAFLPGRGENRAEKWRVLRHGAALIRRMRDVRRGVGGQRRVLGQSEVVK